MLQINSKLAAVLCAGLVLSMGTAKAADGEVAIFTGVAGVVSVGASIGYAALRSAGLNGTLANRYWGYTALGAGLAALGGTAFICYKSDNDGIIKKDHKQVMAGITGTVAIFGVGKLFGWI